MTQYKPSRQTFVGDNEVVDGEDASPGLEPPSSEEEEEVQTKPYGLNFQNPPNIQASGGKMEQSEPSERIETV